MRPPAGEAVLEAAELPHLVPDEVPVTGRMMLAELMAKPAPKPEDTPPPDRVTATAHLLDGATTHMQHTTRHFLHVKEISGQLGDDRLDYHVQHEEEHLGEALDHLNRLKAALCEYYPEIGAELDQLHLITQLNKALPPSRSFPPSARSLPAEDYLPKVADKADELRSITPLPRPARPVTHDNYDVTFIKPGGPEPA
jgi:hypothetical protein